MARGLCVCGAHTHMSADSSATTSDSDDKVGKDERNKSEREGSLQPRDFDSAGKNRYVSS